MGHDSLKKRPNRKKRAKRRAHKIHAARDREICRVRRREKLSHSKLAKKFGLTISRISQILKDGGAMGIRAPYCKPEKPKIAQDLPPKPNDDKELPSERAWMKRWARHVPFLKEFEEI